MERQEETTTTPVSIPLDIGMFSTFNHRKIFEVIERSEEGASSNWNSYDLEAGIYIAQKDGADNIPIISISPASAAPTGFEESKKRMVLRHQMAVASIQVDRIENQDSDRRVFLNGTSIGVTDILATDPVEIKFIQTPLQGDFLDVDGTPFTIEGVILKHLTEDLGSDHEQQLWEFTILFKHTGPVTA